MDNTFSINWNHMQGLRISITQHDEEDLRSFLMGFRKFVSQGEPTHLDRIYNICRQSIRSDQLQEGLVQSRAAWRAAQRGGGIKIVFNERNLTPTLVMDLLVNGYYFHNDSRKAAALQEIWPNPITQFTFNNFLVDATRQVFYVGNVVAFALHEQLVDP
jgi:hypothetical protein